jgi:hypothetical protein
MRGTLCIVLLICWTNLFGQIRSQANRVASSDTTQAGKKDTTKRNTFLTIFNGNPGRAALYSFILPGAGQAYNKKWLKVPLAWAVDGVAGYWVYFTRKQYREYDSIYKALLRKETVPNFNSPNDVLPLRTGWRQRSEYAWVYFTIAHLVTVFDAYVDRHLIEFDIDDNISQHYRGTDAVPIFGVSIALR